MSTNVNKMSISELVSVYNGLTPDKPVKSFRDKPTALKRVKARMAEANVKTNGAGSPARGRRLGIGVRMSELLREGLTTEEILTKIHDEFPLSRATAKDVSIMRRREGLEPVRPQDRA